MANYGAVDTTYYQGGAFGATTLSDFYAQEISPHTKWVQQVRLATDFINGGNSVVCLANSPYHEYTTQVYPFGILQNFSYNESIPTGFVKEIGSRRGRAAVGSSSGGSLNLSRALIATSSTLRTLTVGGVTTGVNPAAWQEQDWISLCGLNHDMVRNPIGIIVAEKTPDGKLQTVKMFEQCLIQGQGSGYQAGNHLVMENISLIYEQMVPMYGAKE